MSLNPNIAEIAALVGDPARTNILAALMDGRALTATELAYVARVSPQTTSGHLAKLTTANLLTVEKQGRHRYYRIASSLIGQMLESIMVVAGNQVVLRPPRASRLDDDMRMARTCYDHLAGRLGVALADTLLGLGHVTFVQDGGEVTQSGFAFFAGLGIALNHREKLHRVFCRPCLDWSERRPHIAGAVGARLCEHYLEQGWIRRRDSTRALNITPLGRRGFSERFGIDFLRLPEGAAA
jgi:DNA-binding transcriptional ArsR family regulator